MGDMRRSGEPWAGVRKASDAPFSRDHGLRSLITPSGPSAPPSADPTSGALLSVTFALSRKQGQCQVLSYQNALTQRNGKSKVAGKSREVVTHTSAST